MKRQIRKDADVIKRYPVDDDLLSTYYRIYKAENPSLSESIFKGYIRGECGPNGGKIRKKRPKHILFDGLDLSEMLEGE